MLTSVTALPVWRNDAAFIAAILQGRAAAWLQRAGVLRATDEVSFHCGERSQLRLALLCGGREKVGLVVRRQRGSWETAKSGAQRRTHVVQSSPFFLLNARSEVPSVPPGCSLGCAGPWPGAVGRGSPIFFRGFSIFDASE